MFTKYINKDNYQRVLPANLGWINLCEISIRSGRLPLTLKKYIKITYWHITYVRIKLLQLNKEITWSGGLCSIYNSRPHTWSFLQLNPKVFKIGIRDHTTRKSNVPDIRTWWLIIHVEWQELVDLMLAFICGLHLLKCYLKLKKCI